MELPEDDGCERIAMCVDELRAVIKVKESRVILHPSLQECGETLDPYDYDFCEGHFTRAVAGHTLLWAHAAAMASVDRVEVSRISDEGKVSFILQVRAKEDIKKGSLCLAPAYGEISQNNQDAQRELAKKDGVVHAAMLSHVEAKVVSKDVRSQKPRSKEDVRTVEDQERTQPKVTPFVIGSPLLAGKATKARETCMENLAPFWALLGCAGPRADYNMELDTVVLRDTGFDNKSSDYPKLRKGVEFTVHLVIARNSTLIKKGEVLLLPFLET